MERQRAAYRIVIHKAEHLPRMDTGIMATVKKTLTMTHTAYLDAFTAVSFMGHKVRNNLEFPACIHSHG